MRKSTDVPLIAYCSKTVLFFVQLRPKIAFNIPVGFSGDFSA